MSANDRVLSDLQNPDVWVKLPTRKLVSNFRNDEVETEQNIRKRYSFIYERVKAVKASEGVKEFVFNSGFDGDGGLGAGLNQSSVDFILWLASSYHDLIHLFRCGAQGSDQVQRMAKTLYGHDGFFNNIHDYVGNSPVFVESLPTADSVADPSGVITYLKKTGVFKDARFGYMGAACWATKRILPSNLPVPEQTVHGEPMGTVYYENRDGSMREKVELLLQYGRPAYAQLFERLEKKYAVHSEGLGASFLGANYIMPNDPTTSFQDFDPPNAEGEHLFWCIVQTLRHYYLNVMNQDNPPVLYKEKFLMDRANWKISEFRKEMSLFFANQYFSSKVLQKISKYNYRLARDGPMGVVQMIEDKPWQSIEHLTLLSYCFNIQFNVFTVGDDATLKVFYRVRTNFVDYGSDSAIVQRAFPLVVNLLKKNETYSVLIESTYGLKEETRADVDQDDEMLSRLPPLPSVTLDPVTSYTGSTETLPGFAHYSKVDWNEYLTVPNPSANPLDNNTLQIIENGLKIPVKTHMAHVQDRYELNMVDPKYYTGLIGYFIVGFRDKTRPSGVVRSDDGWLSMTASEYSDVFDSTNSSTLSQRFMKSILIGDTLRGSHGVPRYAYNLSFYTFRFASDGSKYANNFLKEKSAFDYHFYDQLEKNLVKVKIEPKFRGSVLISVEVSIDNKDFIPNESGYSDDGYCRHRYKLQRTDWCGTYMYDRKHKCFKLSIRNLELFSTLLNGKRGPPLYQSATAKEPIQAEASYYLFYNSKMRRLCIINQYQFEKHFDASKNKFPWTDSNLKAHAVSRGLTTAYDDTLWNDEFEMDFNICGAVKELKELTWEYNKSEWVVKHPRHARDFVMKLLQPLGNLKIYYSEDTEIMINVDERFDIRLDSNEDKAKMWYNFMQSKPWQLSKVEGTERLSWKKSLEHGDNHPASEQVTWKPPELHEGDKWGWLDEPESKKEKKEREDKYRKLIESATTEEEKEEIGKSNIPVSKTKQLFIEGIKDFYNIMIIGGKSFWHRGELYIETSYKVNHELQDEFEQKLHDSLPLKRGEMDLCIPSGRIHFEAMSFLDFGYLPGAGHAEFLYNTCMSVWVALLSLWKQPNAFCRLDFKQLSMLNYLMADPWSNFSRFFERVEVALQQPVIRPLLVREIDKQTYTLETWRLEIPGVLACVRVRTNDVYTKDLISMANKQLMAKFVKMTTQYNSQLVRQKLDYEFMVDIFKFDEAFRSVEPYLTVLRPTLPSVLPDEYLMFKVQTPEDRFAFSSFDVDYEDMERYRFEDEKADQHYAEFDPPKPGAGDMAAYIRAYQQAFEACDSFHCLYMLCSMIRSPGNSRYHNFESRYFYKTMCELWSRVFEQYLGFSVECVAAKWINKINRTICWYVRGAFREATSAYAMKSIFQYTESILTKANRDTRFINDNFAYLVYQRATNFELEASEVDFSGTGVKYRSTKKWSPSNLKTGLEKIKKAAQDCVMEHIKFKAKQWDRVMHEISETLKLSQIARDNIKRKVNTGMQKSGLLKSDSEEYRKMYKELKNAVWLDFDYITQRDLYRDVLHIMYEKQVEKLRVLFIHDSITRHYNKINVWHVNMLREAHKSFEEWNASKDQGERGPWPLHPHLYRGRFYNMELKIDAARYTPENPQSFPFLRKPPSRPSLPERPIVQNNADLATSGIEGKHIEPAEAVISMDVHGALTGDDVSNRQQLIEISQVVLAYSRKFAPLISPDMPLVNDDEKTRSQILWSSLFDSPFEYNLGIFKLKRQGKAELSAKNITIFDTKETASFMNGASREILKNFERNKIRHAIFFTAAGNVFHYIRSIPLILKHYRFSSDLDQSNDAEKLRGVLSQDKSITSGELYIQNNTTVDKEKQRRLKDLLQSVWDDDGEEDTAAIRMAVRSEMEYVYGVIKETKNQIQVLHNDKCQAPQTEREAELRVILNRLERKKYEGSASAEDATVRINRQKRIQTIREELTSLEDTRLKVNLKLVHENEQKLQNKNKFLNDQYQNLRRLQLQIFDLPYEHNKGILDDQIKRVAQLLSTLSNQDRQEGVELLRELRSRQDENQKQHEDKIKLLQGQTEMDLEMQRINAKELERIEDVQREIRTSTHDSYVSFLHAQQKLLTPNQQPPEIQMQLEDLRGLLMDMQVVVENPWIAPLWMVESFLREYFHSREHDHQIARKLTDWAKKSVWQNAEQIKLHCGCIKYFLHSINESKGNFSFAPVYVVAPLAPLQPVSLGSCFSRFSHQGGETAPFLNYVFSARTKEVVEKSDRECILSAICSAANLHVDVFEPFYNLKCALVAEEGSNQFASSIMLDPRAIQNYQSSLQFFFDEKDGITTKIMEGRGKPQFALPDNKRVVVRGRNKPVFYVDLGRRKLVQNLGWNDGSSQYSFFKSLAHGLYTDNVTASHEFVIALIRDIQRRLKDDQYVFNNIISGRMDTLHEIFQHERKRYELERHHLDTWPFYEINSNKIWVYYCQLLCAGLPKAIEKLSDHLNPTDSELQCFCNHLNMRFEITKMDNEVEFSAVDFSSSTRVVESTGSIEYHGIDQSVIRMMHFRMEGTEGCFGRFVDCIQPPLLAPLPDRISVGKSENDGMLGGGEKWESVYLRLSTSSKHVAKYEEIEAMIKACVISDVFNNDIFISEEGNFILWRVGDSWIIQALENFKEFAEWMGSGVLRGSNLKMVTIARIDYKADILGECSWYLRNNKQCNISVNAAATTGRQVALQDPSAKFTGNRVQPFKLNLLNTSCSKWPSRSKNPEFHKRLKGLCMFRQDGGLVPMRLWQASEEAMKDMTEDNSFRGTMRKHRSAIDYRSDDDDDQGNYRSKRAAKQARSAGGWSADDIDRGGAFSDKQKADQQHQLRKQSHGKGNSTKEEKEARAAAKQKSASGGGGTGKHNKAKDYVNIEEGTKRGGVRRKVGAKNLCPNRMFGSTLFRDRKAREEYWKREGDVKNDHFSYFHEKQQRHKEDQREEADDLRRRAKYAKAKSLMTEFFLGMSATWLNANSGDDQGNYTVINEDLKPSFMLTTGLFESIITLETFGRGDCVSIKLIQGTTEECMTLALFLSCFFEESTTLCMFDQFTDNLTFAGKGFVPEMADFWNSTELLMSVADITPEEFLALREKIPSIWESRAYFIDGDNGEVSLHEHEARIRTNSTKLWWAHHRSLTIAALAFVTYGLYGKVWPCKYITEEEAWKGTQLLHKSKDSMAMLENLRQSPFGGQLRPIYDMAEFVAVRHPMRPIHTHDDRDVRATVEMFHRTHKFPRSAPAAASAVGLRYLLQ